MQRPAPAGLTVQQKGERQIQQGRAAHAARFAPIQPGMREQNRNPADEKADEAERHGPVREPNGRGLCRIHREHNSTRGQRLAVI